VKLHHPGSILLGSLALAALSVCMPATDLSQAHTTAATSTNPSAVLVELFTSEGCSSCPPADELLRQISGRKTSGGQLIVGLSEHVSYWNSLGWRDPYSSEQYTGRQNDYGTHFGLDSVYTPQVVVNGREQFVGSDRRSLDAAFVTEAQRKQIELHITSVQIIGKDLTFSYSAAGLPAKSSLQLVAVLVDDSDRSNVLRGENSGRVLIHASVARALAPLGILHETNQRSVGLPLPPSFTASSGTGHHLVLFAQQSGAGAVLGIDTKPI
jgi:hypothetical protein